MAGKRPIRPRALDVAQPLAAAHAATAATIVAIDEGPDARVTVRVAQPSVDPSTPATRAMVARVASIPGYLPTVGDRVLVAGTSDELYVIGVLRAAALPVLTGKATLPDGGSVTVADGAMELRDPEGRLLVRYAAGAAEIAAPAGDLVLSAPAGRVVLRSGLDVALEATRDVVQRAGRAVELSARVASEPDAPPQLRLDPRTVTTTSDRVVTSARQVHTEAKEVTTRGKLVSTTADAFAVATGRYELSATTLVEKARDAYRDVSDLAQSRIGRVRMIVAGVYAQRARRTVIKSEADTSIDGRKVLLG